MHNEFDQRCREILADILEKSHGSTNGVHAKRYRADHIEDRERLDMMVNKRALEMDSGREAYLVGPIGLYFAQGMTRDLLLADINRILDHLRERYTLNLGQPVRLAEMVQALNLERARLEECLDHILRGLTMSRSTNLQEPDAFIAPSESLLAFARFEDYLGEEAPRWVPEAFEVPKAKIKPHGNTEVNAKKREQVLGAAITAIVNWPNECKKGGSFNGTRIANLIDQKARLWWEEGEAPLEVDSMARLINQYLRLPE